MGLLFKKRSGQSGTIAVWQITGSETAEQLGRELLQHERTALNALALPEKKRQWLAVRMLLAELGSSSTLISYDEQGKPFLQDQKIFISLSHSKDRAAIALDQRPTGIDIEYISEKIERVAGKFMSDDELARLPMHQKREALYVHWCVKEALYKLHGKKKLIFREQLILDPFQYNEKGNVTGNIVHDKKTERHELRYEKTGDYMLAYVSYN